MKPSRFDTVARLVATIATRRVVWRDLVLVLSAGQFARQAVLVAAKNKKKPKKKKVARCLKVGQHCRGQDSRCCSGRCAGNKPKKRKKDTSRCVGHDASTCLPGQREIPCGGAVTVDCTTSAGLAGRCATTTGNAAFCRAFGVSTCMACRKDRDCQGLCGPGAACILCTNCSAGTACTGIADDPVFPCTQPGND